MHLVCPGCSTVNRVAGERLNEHPVCGSCKAPLLTHEPAVLTAASFDGFVARTGLPVIVDFWADWCGPCKMMAPQFAHAARDLAGRFQFAKIDTDAHPAVSMRHHIRSIPTLILFRDGVERDRVSGALSAVELKRWLLAR
ncbi:MAG: thioredoxin TrxC [Betaproteobacteria bacterium]|jgi:thioredoxin 2|nr:thioredoxin TrxC [Betaproteobacteria bacterium]MBK7081162.1 thioredoxin TrxC [Betaproteobacteria bacterium]MBK7589965.1 thioredoxin TrxC [Betaproteobacteria bacterium]MBK7743575.1 thioredoxin TrxC [Betaproteobacteria bacterium]MBK8687135.1 thioredoxin TrxC [Betaproteobacteria bacterium]